MPWASTARPTCRRRSPCAAAAIGRDPSGPSGRELRPHLVDDLPRRRHHPDDDQGSPIDDRFAVHENLVLTVVSPDGFHLNPELTAQARRHTDGVYARDSECAIANRYPSHGSLITGRACDAGKGALCPSGAREPGGTDQPPTAPVPPGSAGLGMCCHEESRCRLRPAVHPRAHSTIRSRPRAHSSALAACNGPLVAGAPPLKAALAQPLRHQERRGSCRARSEQSKARSSSETTVRPPRGFRCALPCAVS